MFPLSACTFIKDNFRGAFCLFESMASWLPLVSEFVILDQGSEDGTLQVLRDIADANEKVSLFEGQWSRNDASAFADAANKCIDLCSYDHVLFYQADEIPHERVLRMAKERFAKGGFDLSFWRVQLTKNFQLAKWLPHVVHRVGVKGNFEFVSDGMNTDRMWDAKLVYDKYNGGWFTRWGQCYDKVTGRLKKPTDEWDPLDYPPLLPIEEMLLDVGKSGGFRDNIAARARLHDPFWPGEAVVDGVPVDVWEAQAKADPDWEYRATAFKIPTIMRFHVGRPKYELRRSLYDALMEGDTEPFLGGEL